MGKLHRPLGAKSEAVRLVETSGRTQNEFDKDFGIAHPTLRRWFDKRQERNLRRLLSSARSTRRPS